MRRLMILACVGILALAVLCSATRLFAAPVKYLTLCWEAEDARGITGKVFRVKKLPEDPSGMVSGKKVLEIPRVPKGEKVKPDSVYYKVNIPATGTYYFWARTLWSTGCGNTFTLKLAGFPGDWVIGKDASYDFLHWVCLTDTGDDKSKVRPLHLKKGVLKITLATREAGVMADQFVLTNDPQFQPAGIYKATKDLLVLKD